jgi:hypothetical protein
MVCTLEQGAPVADSTVASACGLKPKDRVPTGRSPLQNDPLKWLEREISVFLF